MSRPERVGNLLRQIEHETQTAFDEYWDLRDQNDKLKAENEKLRYVAESLGMVANDLVCDYYDRDEMLAKANADLRALGIEVA